MASSAARTAGGSSTSTWSPNPASRCTAARDRVLTERDGKVWPSFGEDVIFELGIERALLTLTQADGQFPAGPTIWTAGNGPGG
jgi:hypothetical protein